MRRAHAPSRLDRDARPRARPALPRVHRRPRQPRRQKDGHCGGVNDGGPCDVEGESVDFGATSTDCQPRDSAIGTLPIDIDRLTTAQIVLHASEKCADDRYSAAASAPDKRRRTPAAPETARSRSASRVRSMACAPARHSAAARPAATTRTAKRASSARGDARRAHGRASPRSATCGARDKPRAATFVGTFCTPATTAPALNASAGLPGPARLILPLERVDAPPARTDHQAGVKASGGGRGAHRD